MLQGESSREFWSDDGLCHSDVLCFMKKDKKRIRVDVLCIKKGKRMGLKGGKEQGA